MRRVRDLYGWSFASVAGGATEFGYVGPIAGVGRIVKLTLLFGRLAATPGGGGFRLAWVSTVPASAGDITAGEMLFPFATNEGGVRGRLWVGTDPGVLVLMGPFGQEAFGRYLGVECLNVTADAGIAGVYLEWERGRDGGPGGRVVRE